MNVKQSMLDNKDQILEGLPTPELKNSFLAELDKVEDAVEAPIDELMKTAHEAEHVSEDLYDGIKAEIESAEKFIPMTEAETKAAIENELKSIPTAPEG